MQEWNTDSCAARMIGSDINAAERQATSERFHLNAGYPLQNHPQFVSFQATESVWPC